VDELQALAVGTTRRGYKRARPTDDDANAVEEEGNTSAPYVTWTPSSDDALESELTSFANVPNKWAVAITPSIDMQMQQHQQEPSSSLWFGAIRANPETRCAYSVVGKYRNLEIRGSTSLADLEANVRQWLPGDMRVGKAGSLMPTSLFIIVQG